MKVISKEEEAAHYREVVKGGLIGGTGGLILGLGGVMLGMKRYQFVRQLSLPFRAFLVTSAGTFGAIILAEQYSVTFQRAKDPMLNYIEAGKKKHEQERLANVTSAQRFMEWGRENRYSIVFASWIAAMGAAMAIVNRNKYLSASQKLVQARVYAQGLTLAVLIATAAFETADAKSGKGRWETVMVVDPNDPNHEHLIEKKVKKEDYEGQNLWQDMVAAEEKRLAHKKALEKQQQEEANKASASA
ncbi:hypothetical protein NEUTE1DRAFT_119041 [Neurospora tetrasperma FGSC 2508]|uniref:HIG1 domain-containing protein n=2 Tax=Neurospora TaxID=5140 RepID=A0AAJ0I323_9PEZI|nr:uncharacterized protein NEUTE1DRAFT_119041 [Neurospora tetrasperma FGSC 2508]EGO53036.1 hypothetical protein NEUTE1DRAFT_119041 [Neurospora tetrasperma FGSC 2508]EGZ77872.1 hypothetical protein NEUTE2DRAFT_143001 [Neurospora tetrasperma FGSC 2509]KAK3488840.1 hypothetical protein B0T23DRAFT_186179 [Neurospora hispaniola]